MNASDMKNFQSVLLSLRGRLTGEVSQLSDEALRQPLGDMGGSPSNMPMHMADLGTDNAEKDFTLCLIENEEERVKEINAALDRIDQKTFGNCEECQKPIPKPRLQALPYARHCVDCARKLQQSA